MKWGRRVVRNEFKERILVWLPSEGLEALLRGLDFILRQQELRQRLELER